MRLGVDFGTTRIVIAAADRGNYPLVGFETPDGQMREWFPPLIAFHSGSRRFGWNTLPVQADPQWTVVRSLKRSLKDAGPRTTIDIGQTQVPLQRLLVEMLTALREELYTRSVPQAERGEALEVMVGVPANANSNQRFLTVDAFREAGFTVLGLVNEPSAASIEFGHRNRASRKSQTKTALLVYDLGGGTFDASLVELGEHANSVVATSGISSLGGDDFDEILADLVIRPAETLTPAERFRLLEECQEKKEALNSNTRKIVIDLDRVRSGLGEIAVPVSQYYENCRSLIEQTRDLVERMLDGHPQYTIETLYVTGGGAELPPVARILKETFGRRVRRSAYMRSATAIGLAIGADPSSGYRVRDRLTRNFGVWRETEQGRNITFDLLLSGGADLPASGEPPFRIVRSYRPVHNIGHLRYVECSQIDSDLQPLGDITAWDDIRFPFDPALRDHRDLAAVAVNGLSEPGQVIEEEYEYDSDGRIHVTVSNKSAGYKRAFSLASSVIRLY